MSETAEIEALRTSVYEKSLAFLTLKEELKQDQTKLTHLLVKRDLANGKTFFKEQLAAWGFDIGFIIEHGK